MAEATSKNYFAGTEFSDSIANEKRALLAFVAEKGAEGQAAYEASRTQATDARSQSLEKAAARGASVNQPAALQTEIAQNYDLINDAYANALTQSQLSHGREMDRIALASGSYQDATAAAGGPLKAILDQQLALAALARSGGGGGGGRGSGPSWPGAAAGEPTVPEEMLDQERHTQDLWKLKAAELARRFKNKELAANPVSPTWYHGGEGSSGTWGINNTAGGGGGRTFASVPKRVTGAPATRPSNRKSKGKQDGYLPYGWIGQEGARSKLPR